MLRLAFDITTMAQSLCVVESVEQTVSADNEVIKVIHGYINKAKVTYQERDIGVFPQELTSGDIVRVVMGGTNRVKRLQILASAKRNKEAFFDNLDGNDWSSYYGQLYAKSDTGVTLTMDGGKSVTAFPYNNTTVYVYNMGTKTVKVGSINDLVMTCPIMDDGRIDLTNSDSMVYIYKRKGYARNIVVVKY